MFLSLVGVDIGGINRGHNRQGSQGTGDGRSHHCLGSSGRQETPQNTHPGEGALLTPGEGTLRTKLAMTMNETMVRFSIGFGQ